MTRATGVRMLFAGLIGGLLALLFTVHAAAPGLVLLLCLAVVGYVVSWGLRSDQ